MILIVLGKFVLDIPELCNKFYQFFAITADNKLKSLSVSNIAKLSLNPFRVNVSINFNFNFKHILKQTCTLEEAYFLQTVIAVEYWEPLK